MTELVRTYKLTDSGAWGWVTEEAEGGGGGSLPSWWTVDSTPGSESVEFAGAAIINVSTPAEDGDNILTLGAVDGLGPTIRFDTYGSIYGQSLSLSGTDDDFAALTLLHLTSTASQTALVGLENQDGEVFGIANSGAVTISPSDPAVDSLARIVAPAGFADGTEGDGNLLGLYSTDLGAYMAQWDIYGNATFTTPPALTAATVWKNGDGSHEIRFAISDAGANAAFGGTVAMANLPTADPTVVGQLWNDTGTVKVSAG